MRTILIVGGYGNTGYYIAELLMQHADASRWGFPVYWGALALAYSAQRARLKLRAIFRNSGMYSSASEEPTDPIIR